LDYSKSSQMVFRTTTTSKTQLNHCINQLIVWSGGVVKMAADWPLVWVVEERVSSLWEEVFSALKPLVVRYFFTLGFVKPSCDTYLIFKLAFSHPLPKKVTAWRWRRWWWWWCWCVCMCVRVRVRFNLTWVKNAVWIWIFVAISTFGNPSHPLLPFSTVFFVSHHVTHISILK
jgi:hypothetical protein